VGLIYTGIMAVSLPGSEPFYKMVGVIEMALTLAITVIALRWPRESAMTDKVRVAGALYLGTIVGGLFAERGSRALGVFSRARIKRRPV
jgi:hypothetical protein